jgi:tetratricopeptide (TPR) repeat protein
MIFEKITSRVIVGAILAMIAGTQVWAESNAQESDKIKQILMNTKLGELDMKVDQATATTERDVSSVQYKIGFKDGYQKAVADLKNSLNQQTVTPAATKVAQPDNPGKAAALQAKSFQELVKEGDWDAAIQAATQAIKLNPRDHVAYINRSWGNAEKGNYKQAINDANIAVGLKPNNPVAHNNRAYAYELSGALTEAKKDYKKACELNYQPACETVAKFDRAAKGKTIDEVEELLNRSYEKFRNKDWKAVEQISTRAISLDPANAMAYVNRSGARAELGLLSPALEDCNRAIQLNPGLGLAHNNCGYTYELMGRAKQAELEYQQACNLGVKESCKDYHRISK